MSSTAQVLTLSQYLEASTEHYSACLDALSQTHAIPGFESNVRFHHLRIDKNGEPKFKDLAEVLADHIIEYCFASRRRNNPKKAHEFSKLNREARAYLRKMDTSGEAGEMLLYFLLEAVLGAPQMVAKMELKTNPRMEGHGSDGIHMKWNETDGVLDIYFGEAKLEQTVYSGLSSMIKSLETFHADGLMDHEYGLVTSHYKHADEATRKAVLDILDRKAPGPDCRINHACLVGYDWDTYRSIRSAPNGKHQEEFVKHYQNDLPRLKKLLDKHFSHFSKKHLRFEVFVLPFRTVQEFRNAFLKAVS